MYKVSKVSKMESYEIIPDSQNFLLTNLRNFGMWANFAYYESFCKNNLREFDSLTS